MEDIDLDTFGKKKKKKKKRDGLDLDDLKVHMYQNNLFFLHRFLSQKLLI